jgi:protein ImuB
MNAPSRRYLSVWLRRLATDRIARLSSAPAEVASRALVVIAPVKGALRLAAMNDAAAALGLKAGIALADARAMYPALPAVDADPEEDQRTLIAIADWCDRYTPLAGLDEPDGLTLDITGCAHLFGGEEAMSRDMLRRLAAQGFAARLAVANTVGCAWGVARFGKGGIVPKGEGREALSPLPLAALRLSSDIVAALARAGLKYVADVIDLPRAPLAARFPGLVRRIDQALGREEESISPRLPLPSYVVEQRFADPIALERDVLGTIEHLAGELGRTLERHGEGARLLQAALFRTDGKVYRIDVGTSAPLREAQHIRRLFTERLVTIGDDCDPGFGYDVVRLSVLAAERSDPVQANFVAADQAQDLSHLIDRLGARFGLRRVTRFEAQDTHIPEFAVAAVPAGMGRRYGSSFPSPVERSPRSGGVGVGVGVRGRSEFHPHRPHPRPLPTRGRGEGEAEQDILTQDSLAPVRPIRLFEHPEPITKVVAEVPDGPPGRFHWRRVEHHVVAAEGPERIAMEWWRDENGRAQARDYFRIECTDGLRVWLYREGLFAGTEPPSWFVHGIFA